MLFELTRHPSKSLDSPYALLPELQRNKDTVRRIALSAGIPGQRPDSSWCKPWLCAKTLNTWWSLRTKSQLKSYWPDLVYLRSANFCGWGWTNGPNLSSCSQKNKMKSVLLSKHWCESDSQSADGHLLILTLSENTRKAHPMWSVWLRFWKLLLCCFISSVLTGQRATSEKK